MSNLYMWMVLNCDMWQNKNVSHEILFKFVQNQFRWVGM
jgi:hypothetical protein